MRLTSFHAPSPTARWSCFLFTGQHSSSIYLLHFPTVNYSGVSAIPWEPLSCLCLAGLQREAQGQRCSAGRHCQKSSARQSWQRARLCNRLLFLLMDNSLLEMKYETFADNGCPRSMVTVIWPSRMQPVTCNYYQLKSYGLIMCHLCSQNAGSAASIHLHWPAVQVLSASWYQAKSQCPGVSWGTAGPGWKPHSTVLSVPGFPADYIPGVKEKINMLIKLKRRKK